MIARPDILRQPGKADGGHLRRPLHGFGGQGKGGAFGQGDLGFRKGAQANLRPLGIDQHGDRQIQFLTHLLHLIDAYPLAILILVRHVDARDVHAGQHQLTKHRRVIGGGPQGADDFCFTLHNI